MTLIEAMEKAKDGQIIERKYTVEGAGTFTMWGTIEITEHGKFLKQGWGTSLKLESLKADNWDVIKTAQSANGDIEQKGGDEYRVKEDRT